MRSWLSNAAIDPEDIRTLEEDGASVGYVDLLRSEEVAHLDNLE